MALDYVSFHYRESMIFSLNGMQLILSNKYWRDNWFKVWDLTTKTQLQKGDYYPGVGEPAVFQPDASGGGIVTVIRSPITGSCVRVISEGRPKRVVFTPDGMRFALNLEVKGAGIEVSGSIYILDAVTGTCLQKLADHSSRFVYFALSPDGSKLATAYGDTKIHIWDVKTGASLFKLLAYTGLTTVAFSPEGTELASAAGDQTIRIWDLILGTYVEPDVDPEVKRCIYSITFSSDSIRLALVTTNNKGTWGAFNTSIEIWDPVEGICQQQLRISNISIDTAPAFSPDNTRFAYSTVFEMRVWELEADPQHDRAVFEISGVIQSIVFSPSGTRLAVAGIEAPKAEIRDTANGTIVCTFYFAAQILNMQFSSDGKRFGAMSNNGIATIWDMDTGACLHTLDFKFREIFGTDVLKPPVDDLRRTQSHCFLIKMLQNPDSRHGGIHEFDLSLNKNWLLRRGQPFLWLPPEYRPQDMTFAGGRIAMRLHSETILFLSFCLAELDAEMASNRSSILKVQHYTSASIPRPKFVI
jgi:WD40 repeat protein